MTENVRARLRNRNLTNERKFLLNFESRQIPCDIFANSQVIFGHSFCQFFGSSVAQYLCEYHRLSAHMICTAVETFYKENYAKRLAESKFNDENVKLVMEQSGHIEKCTNPGENNVRNKNIYEDEG